MTGTGAQGIALFWRYTAVPLEQSRILVLEDEPAILSLVAAALESAGFTDVRSSATIAEARKAWSAQQGDFALFLTDFSLPDGSAKEIIGELLASNSKLRVLLMSGFSEEMLDLDSRWARQVRTIQKPFRPSELRTLVGEMLAPRPQTKPALKGD